VSTTVSRTRTGTATRSRSRRPAVRRWAGGVPLLAAALALSACDTTSATPQSVVAGEDPGVTLSADIGRGAGGGLTVDYRVRNGGGEPVIITDGVPARDTGLLPEPDSSAAYVKVRAGGTVEVSRRTFAAPGRSERSGTVLMLGTLLRPGQDMSGSVRLERPVRLYRPYASAGPGGTSGATERAELPDSARTVVFCLGVVDQGDVEVGLQGKVDDEHRVLRHPTRQLLLCSPETDLPR